MIDATRPTCNQEIINSYLTGYNKGKLDSKIEFIEKACKWLESIAEYIGHDSESIKESFKKYINENQGVKRNT